MKTAPTLIKGLFCLLLLGCGGSSSNILDVIDADMEEAVVDLDSAIPPDTTPFNKCVSIRQALTVYPRLQERDCVASDGTISFKDYWDIKLKLGCYWNIAGDGVVRCLPESEMSSPFYADNMCQNRIALAEVSQGKLVEPYIGLDRLDDAGTYLDMYLVGEVFGGSTMYHLEQWGQDWGCYSFWIKIPGTDPYYVGASVDPSIFVPKIERSL